MNVAFDITTEKDHTFIRTEGHISSLEEHIELIVKLYSEVVRLGLKRILVDDSKVRYVNRIWDTFQFGEYLTRLLTGDLHYFTMAVSVNPDSVDIARFFETVCINRGINVRIFDNLDSAKNWLESL
jgi:hypothetical protein